MARAAKSTSTKPSAGGVGCGMLFLLPFAAVGVLMAVLTIWTLVDWQRMQSWQATPAELLSLELKQGDDTDRIYAEYSYTFGGQRYTGDRVAIDQMGDNLGDYQKRNYRKLRRKKEAGKPVTAYVNPANPSEAVLLRDLRLGMLAFKAGFALIFGLVGIGGMIGLVVGARKARVEQATATENPEEPWLWRDDWREGVIQASSAYTFMGMLTFAALWNFVSWSAGLAMYFSADRPPWWVMLIVVGFVLIGATMIAAAGVSFVRWRRFPEATFRMATTPGVVGGQLAGVVVVPRRVRPQGGFRATLTSTRVERSGEDTTRKVLWQDERVIVRTLDGGDMVRTSVPVAFTIPSDARPSDPHADDPIEWTLNVAADLPGPNLDFAFEVPVFRTEESRDDVVVAAEPLTEYEQVESLDTLLAREKIIVEPGAGVGDVRYRVPPARHLGLCVGLTVFAAIWSAVVVGLFLGEVWFFAAVFGLFGVLMLLLAVHVWLSQTELAIDGDQWQHRWGWWPLWFRTRWFSSDEVRQIRIEQNTRSGNKSYGDLVAKLADGKKLKLAGLLASRATERLWADDLRRRAGLLEEGPLVLEEDLQEREA